MQTDHLFLLTRVLCADAAMARELRGFLQRVHDHPAYCAWANGLGQARPFERDMALSQAIPAESPLVREGRLLVKVNRVGGHIALTDGVWADSRTRAFPFADESTALLALLAQLGWSPWPELTVDLATGCGHNLLGMQAGQTLGLDINPRALAYAELNRALNELAPAEHSFAFNDICSGLPSLLECHPALQACAAAGLPAPLCAV
jgi:hypothetical protein